MSPTTLIFAAAVVAIVAMAFAFSGGAVIVAVPLALLAVGLVLLLDFQRRRSQDKRVETFREQAPAEKVDFTERDKETLTSE